jgi:hypothetical protein
VPSSVSRTARDAAEPRPVRSGQGDGTVRAAITVVHLNPPPSFVHLSVMKAAQQQSIGRVSVAAVLPCDDVMGIGVCWRSVAARPSAPSVTCGQQLSLLPREEPVRASEVDYHAVGVEDERRQMRVAGDARASQRV